MSEIVIKSQKEFDALKPFKTLTRVYIEAKKIVIKEKINNAKIVFRSNSSATLGGNASAELRDNSSAELFHNSRAVLYDNASSVLYDNASSVLYDKASSVLYGKSSAELWYRSSAELFNRSVAYAYAANDVIAYENAVVFSNQKNIKIYDRASLKPLETPKVSFEEWLSRGWVVADGIYRKLVSQKNIGEISVYETDKGVVVRKGDKFSHGETVEKAIEDLRYKITNRDTSKFSQWKTEDVKSLDEMIEAYRVITGACEMGVKEFCGRTPLQEKMTVMDAIKITENNYGAEQFKSFFMKGPSE